MPTTIRTANQPLNGLPADFLRYALSGSLAFGADLATYLLMTGVAGWHPSAANLVSRPVGGLVAFSLHKLFTFQNRGRAPAAVQFARFWTVWLFSFAVSQLMVYVYYEWVGFGRELAKLGAEGAAGLLAFLCQRLWTFR